MRTYLIDIYPKGKEEFSGIHEYFQISVPDWFGRNELFLTLKRYTKYNVHVRYPNAWDDLSEYTMALTMESLIEQIKNVKLYKQVEIPIYETIEKVEEVREFRLSYCFTIGDRQFTHAYGYVNGMTFFGVHREIDAKDILFVDDDLKDKLKCSKAKNGRYFMYGEWKFFRSKTKPAHWEARKISKHKKLVGMKVKTIEL